MAITLKSLTAFRLGGPAGEVIRVKNAPDLTRALTELSRARKKFFVMGEGTNIIANDNGYNGTIIRLEGGRISAKNKKVICDAGVPLQKLVDTANYRGLRGLETLAGIPGTVGGAIFGNAGAYGHEISEFLEKVEIFVTQGSDPCVQGSDPCWIPKTACHFEYRGSIFKKKPWAILRAVFMLKKGDARELQKKSREITALRRKKYKPGLRCAGSIFKNIPVKSPLGKKLIKKIPTEKIIGGKISAGYLLESVGAQGLRRGGISVAKHHGNLIVNNGRGTAYEARALIEKLKKRVRKKLGITLEEEVRYLGF